MRAYKVYVMSMQTVLNMVVEQFAYVNTVTLATEQLASKVSVISVLALVVSYVGQRQPMLNGNVWCDLRAPHDIKQRKAV